MSDGSSAGIQTFLFTDLENSTVLWEQSPQAMLSALAQHDALLKKAVEAHHGRIVKTTGDGLHATFVSPVDGVAAALVGQQALATATWPGAIGPLKVRMGLHTGISQERDGDYYGLDVNLAARIMGLGYGGQILLSEVTTKLVGRSLPPGSSLADLGDHRLKGVAPGRPHIPALPSRLAR
jgi:class 3 adenylate cyclase